MDPQIRADIGIFRFGCKDAKRDYTGFPHRFSSADGLVQARAGFRLTDSSTDLDGKAAVKKVLDLADKHHATERHALD
jgi:hypothetical protein